MIEERWFSYPIWGIKTNYIMNDDLLQYCLLRKSYDDGNKKSNIGGWQSSNIYQNSDSTISSFCKFLEIYVNDLQEIIKKKLLFDNFWININGYGTSNAPHVHPRSFISGVYYVKGLEKQGDICFENPSKMFVDYAIDGSTFIEREVFYSPETGKLIFFPSFLPHRVLSNQTNIDRISIAFNMIIKND